MRTKVPHGTSGTNSPYGMRSWKCLSTAVSLLGTEIAIVSPAAAAGLARKLPWAPPHQAYWSNFESSECPACCYVTSVLLQSKGSQKRRSSEK
jgi:hypothetical protein